jgi:serine/threonine-protein kinase
MSASGVVIESNLENVVLGALAKDPDARWQSAEDFAAALEACRPWVEAFLAGETVGEDTAVFAAVPAPTDPDDEQRRLGLRRWPAIALAALVIALIALMAWVFTRPEQIDVPKVTSLQLGEARERLDKAGFENVEVQRESSLADVDEVLAQEPDPGEQAARDDVITLIVSSGPGDVTVPSVEGLTRRQAVRELEAEGLRPTVSLQASARVEEGIAIRTSPREGAEVERRSRIRLFVSSGPEAIEVPNVVGLSLDSATARLDDLDLGYRITREESDRPEDEVIGQEPGAGTPIEPGGVVELTVAKPVEQVSVPFVTDLPEADALRVLQGDGLSGTVRRRDVEDESQDGVVLEQRPGAGVEVDSGSSVTLVVGRFVAPPDTTTPEVP